MQHLCFGGQQKRSCWVEHSCSRGQHLPSTQTVPSGQQNRSFWLAHACGRGQHLPLMHTVPSGQQSRPSLQTRIGGQQVRDAGSLPISGRHGEPGGQHVGPTPLPTGLVQHWVSDGQQATSPEPSTQHFVSSGQHLPVGCPLISRQQWVPGGQQTGAVVGSLQSLSGGHPTHSPLTQVVPGGQHVRTPALLTQICSRRQQIISPVGVVTQMLPSGQQTWGVVPGGLQIRSGGHPVHWPLTHVVPGGQQVGGVPGTPQSCSCRQQTDSPVARVTQTVPVGQHDWLGAVPHSCVVGQKQPFGPQVYPGGQHWISPLT
jgi:hypothetical protein